MVAKKDTPQLAKELPDLDLVQGYLVHKDPTGKDASYPLETRADAALQGVPYTTMKLAVKPIDASCSNSKTAATDDNATTEANKKPKKKP